MDNIGSIADIVAAKASIATAIAGFLAFIVLCRYTKATWELRDAARRQIDLSLMPFLRLDKNEFGLTLHNIGNSTACNVKVLLLKKPKDKDLYFYDSASYEEIIAPIKTEKKVTNLKERERYGKFTEEGEKDYFIKERIIINKRINKHSKDTSLIDGKLDLFERETKSFIHIKCTDIDKKRTYTFKYSICKRGISCEDWIVS